MIKQRVATIPNVLASPRPTWTSCSSRLPVTLVAKVRNDIGGVHMVGPIVEVISIQTR